MKKRLTILMAALALTTACGLFVSCGASDKVVFQVQNGCIVWSYENQEEWNVLVSLDEIKGQDGETGEAGVDGKDGKSAYEIAVEQGYKGTEEEWIASLTGKSGTNGKSAYQIAVENGFKGTEQEWLASLQGKNGETGKSVYEIAKELGYKGTEQEWLASLRGKQGETGATGQNGKDGYTPYIGENGNWWINEKDTGVKATVGDMDRVGTDGLSFQVAIWGETLGYEVIDYNGTATDIVIPNYLFNKPVVSIQQGALPTNMTSLSISSNTEHLPVFAENYDYLLTVDFNNAPVDTLPDNIFKNCGALTTVKNYGNIENIGSYAFYGTKVADYDFDFSKVKTIAKYAFYNQYSFNILNAANKQFIYIPDNVESIGENAFYNDDERFVYYEGDSAMVEYSGSYFYGNVKHTDSGYYYIDNGTSATLLNYDGKDTRLVVPKTLDSKAVKEVAKYAFYLNGTVERVEIPASVTRIGDLAFSYCYKLHSLFIPDSVEDCGEDIAARLDNTIAQMPTVFFKATTFDYEGGITSPDELDIVKYMVGVSPSDIVDDETCVYLKKTLSVEVVTIKSNLVTAEIPSSYNLLPVRKINQYALYGNTLTTVIEIPTSVEKIATKAFYSSSSVKIINVPDSVEDVNNNGFYALSNCTIYVEHKERPSDWDSSWYYSVSKVVWDSQAEYATVNGAIYLYETTSNGIYLSKYYGTITAGTPIIIPEKINGKKVYGVRAYCYQTSSNNSSSSKRYQFVIPDTITVMEQYAIYLDYSYVNVYVKYASASERPANWSSSYVYTYYSGSSYRTFYYKGTWELVDGVPVVK